MTPTFPPLMRGEEAPHPMERAIARARHGTEPGLVAWAWDHKVLEAALVLAPEQPLHEAMAAVLIAANALADALGNAAPPGLPIHHEWPSGLRVNGGLCGRFRAASAGPAEAPDWLVVGFDLVFRTDRQETGSDPDRTALHEEGCGDVAPLALLESWSRHMLHGLSRLEDRGLAGIHAEWSARAWPDPARIGFDEHGGLLRRGPGGTTLTPLTRMLEPS